MNFLIFQTLLCDITNQGCEIRSKSILNIKSVQTVVLHHQHLGKNKTLRDLKKIFNSVFRNEEGSFNFSS